MPPGDGVLIRDAETLAALRVLADRRNRAEVFFLALVEDLRRQGIGLEEDSPRWLALRGSAERLVGEILDAGKVVSYVVRDGSGRVLNP